MFPKWQSGCSIFIQVKKGYSSVNLATDKRKMSHPCVLVLNREQFQNTHQLTMVGGLTRARPYRDECPTAHVSLSKRQLCTDSS